MPRTPNQKRQYAALGERLARYVALVEQIYDELNLEAARLATIQAGYGGVEKERPFRWADYPQTRRGLEELQRRFVEDIGAVISRGTSEEWQQSNEVQDLLCDDVLRAYGAQIDGERRRVLYQTNSEALAAFQQRRDRGMNLSQKLWQQADGYKEALEEAISCAIHRGVSAVTLSKQLSRYLRDFPSLRRDYGERFGRASRAGDCEYRSIRLARSEINMAYREAENRRWEQMDFVVGYEIKLSGRHSVEDICDRLKGRYPKSFRWTGWHPNDLCYKVPILSTEEEFWAWMEGREVRSRNEVSDVPEGFKQWVGTNSGRIAKARKRGTLPYFVRDNQEVVNRILTSAPVMDYYMPSGVLAKSRSRWVDNAVAVEQALGVRQGRPMAFDEANALRGNANYVPEYVEGKRNPSYKPDNRKYHVNCQSCVVANELRRRGYDVTAMPNLCVKGNVPYELSLKTEWAWIDPDTQAMPKKRTIGNTADSRGRIVAKSYKETMHDLMDAMNDPGRYHVSFAWKGRDDGHIITFERRPDGKIKWYDPQSGKCDFFDKYYYGRIRVSRGIKVLRVDNLMINADIIGKVVEPLKK